jgi:serine protease Do
MKFTVILLLAFIPFKSVAQSLSPERVANIKACTVKITVEGNPAVLGMGFFIRSDGLILTCWHLIEAAIIRDPKTTVITGFKKIFISTANGQSIEAGISLDLINKGYIDAISYDYCLLAIVDPKHAAVPFLKLGDYNKLDEGQEVYTCGFPAGTDQPMVTKGIVSSKFVDTTISIMENGKLTKKPRSQALLDMVLNRSGGAIIKPGVTINDDEVVGIANFAIIPNGQMLEQAGPSLIGGCVAINHFLEGLIRMK